MEEVKPLPKVDLWSLPISLHHSDGTITEAIYVFRSFGITEVRLKSAGSFTIAPRLGPSALIYRLAEEHAASPFRDATAIEKRYYELQEEAGFGSVEEAVDI